MKSKMWLLTVVGAFVALPISVGSAQDQQEVSGPHSYTVINLGTLGGTSGIAYGIDNFGWAGGTAYLKGDAIQRAVLWLPGLKIDLGTFGGPNSASEYAPNEFGQAAGWAETSIPDPFGEDFCGFGTHLICLPFVWQFGILTPLPTLGGNNGEGLDINSFGQVVGEAETAVHDSTCAAPSVLQTLPAVWENGRVRPLPTFEGDPDGAAFANNDWGQAVGYSGNCSTNVLAHAVLWQDGKVTNLGSLGGVAGNVAEDINNRGEVVGYSDLPGDTEIHGFLWRNGVMSDLGTLAGEVSDVFSTAYAINNRGQVVGQSCGGANGNCPAFLWQNGTMTDLNTLVTSGASLYLLAGFDINDGGEIVGQAYDASTGDYPAFLAIPNWNGANAAQLNSIPQVALPANVLQLVQRVRKGRAATVPNAP